MEIIIDKIESLKDFYKQACANNKSDKVVNVEAHYDGSKNNYCIILNNQDDGKLFGICSGETPQLTILQMVIRTAEINNNQDLTI
jgi:hypothetical protein